MTDFRPVCQVVGVLLCCLSAAMLCPMLADVVVPHSDWQVFLVSAAITAFSGLALILSTRGERKPLTTRQAFLVAVSAWFVPCVFAALPFMLGGVKLSLVDALFEATSGLTTTGATVLTGLDSMSRGILLWRAIMQWVGGIGIVVIAVAILPLLRIGGMQLFRMENSDKTDKVKPRTSQVAVSIALVYVGLTVVCGILLWWAGMTPFEALCHSMTTVATGGLSTSDSSAGLWDNLTILWIMIVFLILGGITFTLYITPIKNGRIALLHDTQVRWFILFLAAFSLLLGLWLWFKGHMPLWDAITHATFNVVSVVTTAGFASSDYNGWGALPQVVFFFLTFIGGCTGSTSGGVKIFRWEVLFKMATINLKRLVHPHGVFAIDFNRQRVPESAADAVLGFVIIYFMIFAVFSVLLSMCGLDFVTAVSASASGISNVGPGLGDTIGPAGNYQSLPDSAKSLLIFEMLLGRLEIFTLIVLFGRSFWRE